MADSSVAVLESTDPTATKIDNDSVTTGVGAVKRQRVAVPDGANVAMGTTTDAAWVSGAGTSVSVLKGLFGKLEAIRAELVAGVLDVAGPLTDAQLRAVAVPVSGPLTDTQLRAAAVPVSGTFWQATQAVSGPLTDTQLRASRVLVDASGVAVPVTDNGGSFTVDAPVGTPVFSRLSDGAAALVGQKVMASSIPVVLASDQSTVVLKDNRDVGLQNVMCGWEEMAGTAAVESALTNATFRTENFTALGAASSYTVPAAKRLRITNVSCYIKATSTVNNLGRFRIRAVASGSVANNSPPVFDEVLALAAPGTIAAGLLTQQQYTFPEGSLDFATGAQLAFTWFTAANTCTVGMTFVGYLYSP